MDAPNLGALLDHWHLSETRAIWQFDSGTNNLSSCATTRAGEFLLRVYGHGAEARRVGARAQAGEHHPSHQSGDPGKRRYTGRRLRQIVHRDLDPSNVFMAEGPITAVFDFESAQPDLRAFDLAISATTFSTDAAMRQEFVAAYIAGLPLRPQELHALPMLLMIYRTMCLCERQYWLVERYVPARPQGGADRPAGHGNPTGTRW